MNLDKAPRLFGSTGVASQYALLRARLWVILTGALLLLSTATMLIGLWPYYMQVRTPCGDTGFCFPPALFPHDVDALAQYGISLNVYAALIVLIHSCANLGCLAVAGILFRRRRDNPMVLCTVALLATQILTAGYLTAILDLNGLGVPLIFAAYLLTKSIIILFLALFPTGRLFSQRLRWFVPALILIVAGATIIEGVDPLNRTVRVIVYSVETFWISSMMLIQLYRYRSVASPDERRQTAWMMVMFTLYFGYQIVFNWFIGLVGSPDGQFALLRAALFATQYLLQLAVVFGLVMALRQGLYNMRRLLAPAVVYTLLTIGVMGLYIVLVGGISLLFRPRDNTVVALFATGVVAAAFQPLRAALQRSVNQLIYGQRAEPYQVLVLLGERLSGAEPSHAILPKVARVVRDALRLPYVAVTRYDNEDDVLISASGVPHETPMVLPLVFQHERLGSLLVEQRAPDEPFSQHERRLLVALAQHISIALHAARLTAELQHSRERLVDTREEERRRLQRDLHDGLGPTLASMSMQLDAARLQLVADPSGSETLLAEVQDQLRQTVSTVRRIVHQLRPPLLDQLGLLAAIREYALRIERATSVHVRLALPDSLPPLSAAVEVAAYYIVSEALNNMARHARARSCAVQIEATTELRIAVIDNGVGLAAPDDAGVGLRSMRERAQEIGGTWQIDDAEGGGTAVRVRLPLKRIA